MGSAATAHSELWSAGLDTNGQLGRDTVSRAAVELAPVQQTAGLDVTAIAAGARHSLAVLSNGTVYSWGANDRGQLGHGKPGSDQNAGPVSAPDGQPGELHNVVAVAADTDFSMALRSDGTVVTWGAGDAGQRGIGRKAAPAYPTTVLSMDGTGPLAGVKQISADGRTELALLKDGRVLSWGANLYGMLGDGTRVSRSLPNFVKSPDGKGQLSSVEQVAIGGQNGLALLSSGAVLSWGHNDLGQLGDGTNTDRLVPGPVLGPGAEGELTGITAISAAEKHAIVLRSDGTALAWGNNTAGQLGDGTLRQRTSPVAVIGSGSGPLLRGVVSVYAGEAYGAAILTDGTVRTWGSNGRGQLGSGDRVSRDRPGPIATRAGDRIPHVMAIAVGERHLILLSRTA